LYYLENKEKGNNMKRRQFVAFITSMVSAAVAVVMTRPVPPKKSSAPNHPYKKIDFRCPGCSKVFESYLTMSRYPTPYDKTISDMCQTCNKLVEAVLPVSGRLDSRVVIGSFSNWSGWIRVNYYGDYSRYPERHPNTFSHSRLT